jgi:hypothetical protein
LSDFFHVASGFLIDEKYLITEADARQGETSVKAGTKKFIKYIKKP